ncbi:hypothetical protein HDC90_004055 [Pedobacter sp. AK013]|nr:hypothetical protein [Pedobacter sp. AK013]
MKKDFPEHLEVFLLTFRYVFVKNRKKCPALQLNWVEIAAVFRFQWQNIQVQHFVC